MASVPGRDPLATLPSEIVLHVLEYAPTSTLASLTQASKAWHQFIDATHQDAIYSSNTRTPHPAGAHDFSFLASQASFAKYFEGTISWKDLCKRQTLLNRNWAQEQPETRQSIIQVGNDPVWRFKTDFKRRFLLSTSHAGGMNVTDMDSGIVIFRLSDDEVRPCAHLEYQDGTAVWDRDGDALEVWKTDFPGCTKGEFRLEAVLDHDCMTRGFQLSYDTLCVVSNEGQSFVYDMTKSPPKLQTHLKITEGGTGHLDQDEDVVVYSMGENGYHLHDKKTGAFLGRPDIKSCINYWHIKHAVPTDPEIHTSINSAFPPAHPRKDRLLPIKLEPGPLPHARDVQHVSLEDDEWGSGMMHGDLLVGISRGGRVLIFPHYRDLLQRDNDGEGKSLLLQNDKAAIIECESNAAGFDLGGWLSVKDNRIMFEIKGRIYIVAMNDEGEVAEAEGQPGQRASYSMSNAYPERMGSGVPVSFMALYDDCIMTTFTTLGNRRDVLFDRPGVLPTKAIRVLSLAPEPGNDDPVDTTVLDEHETYLQRILQAAADA